MGRYKMARYKETAEEAQSNQINIELAAKEVELNRSSIYEVAKDYGVTITEIEHYLNLNSS